MKELKWERLNLPTFPDFDEMMILTFDIINLELKQKGKLSKETKERIAPALMYFQLVSKKFELERKLVSIDGL